jgi:hypothetical protein
MNTRSIKKKMRYLSALTVLLDFGFIANPVAAEILLTRLNTTPQGGTIAANLDLNGLVNGKQITATFTTAIPNRLVRVIFNAVGAMQGSFSATLDSTILIDPAGQPGPTACVPSNGDNSFVSGNSTPVAIDGWISAVTQCFYRVPTAGVHTIRVVMTPKPTAPNQSSWRVDDLSLVIDDD